MPQLVSLTLFALPNEWLAALFNRWTFKLDRLALTNRDYFPTDLVEQQKQACRLEQGAVDAVVRSQAARSLTDLSVTHNHIGSMAVDLVNATTPGQLTRLELVDVGLNDDAAERLACLPQLRGLTHLSVRLNPLTDRGIATLARSPHLTNLRHLNVGGKWYDPYYSISRSPSQAIGDKGFAALVGSPWFPQLETLQMIDAGVRPAGLNALTQIQGPLALRELDLSLNPLGAAGIKALAQGPVVETVRRLQLRACSLNDVAARHLAAAPFCRLRSLALGYNSIGAEGVRTLADTAALAGLWQLDLTDNVFGEDGLMALAGSTHFTQLVELATEQDVWNYHHVRSFGGSTAVAFTQSQSFPRLDAFFGGVIDGYHGGRPLNVFSREALEILRRTATLRPELRHSIASMKEDEPIEGESSSLNYTPEQIEKYRREQDFRTRNRG